MRDPTVLVYGREDEDTQRALNYLDEAGIKYYFRGMVEECEDARALPIVQLGGCEFCGMNGIGSGLVQKLMGLMASGDGRD
ncbi:MAG: hypothetical protein ABIH92_05955 [Nanoarchaeota archaeon]